MNQADLKIQISALSCSPQSGSEPLVGFQAVDALASRYDVSVITSSTMTASAGVDVATIPVLFSDPNDVSPWQLFQFELRQRALIRRPRLDERPADVFHRVTPSGMKDSLLPVPNVPFVLGPILLSEPSPAPFDTILRPELPLNWSPKALLQRAQNGLARRLFRRLSTIGRLLDEAAVILVGSDTTMRRLPPRWHSRCRRITYAGVDHREFRPPARPAENAVPQLLFVGRLVPYKGVELLLRAAAAARRSCRFELKIVGGGNSRLTNYFVRLRDRLGLGECVEFVGRQPRAALLGMFQQADVFCMPSVETYGLAILEAMSCGCASLVSDKNGPGEIVKTGTGVKVALETPEQFVAEYAQHMIELVENPNYRSELGQAAREHVVRHHDWRDIRKALLAIYEEIERGMSVCAPCCSTASALSAV